MDGKLVIAWVIDDMNPTSAAPRPVFAPGDASASQDQDPDDPEPDPSGVEPSGMDVVEMPDLPFPYETQRRDPEPPPWQLPLRPPV